MYQTVFFILKKQERLLYLFLADADRWTEYVDWLTDMIDCREEDLKI